MSARLRVEELRAELQRRGLDASGNKPVLVSTTTPHSPPSPTTVVAGARHVLVRVPAIF